MTRKEKNAEFAEVLQRNGEVSIASAAVLLCDLCVQHLSRLPSDLALSRFRGSITRLKL
jgi:hypothetical protein